MSIFTHTVSITQPSIVVFIDLQFAAPSYSVSIDYCDNVTPDESCELSSNLPLVPAGRYGEEGKTKRPACFMEAVGCSYDAENDPVLRSIEFSPV